MANPWAGEYENGDIAPGIGGGEISCATKKETREVYFRADKGDQTWGTEPVLAGTVPEGSNTACRVHLRGQYVVVWNGQDWGRKSAAYGAAGSWTDDE